MQPFLSTVKIYTQLVKCREVQLHIQMCSLQLITEEAGGYTFRNVETYELYLGLADL